MLKVAIFSRYPQDPSRPRGGVETVTVVLVGALAKLADLDVHVVTLDSVSIGGAEVEDEEKAVHSAQRREFEDVHRVGFLPDSEHLVPTCVLCWRFDCVSAHIRSWLSSESGEFHIRVGQFATGLAAGRNYFEISLMLPGFEAVSVTGSP